MTEDRELERLWLFLASPGPTFGIAMCTFVDSRVAAEAREELEGRARRAGKSVSQRVVRYDDVDADLVGLLAEASAESDVVFLRGLDELLLDLFGAPRRTRAISALNLRRDQLPERVAARVVLWVREAALRGLREHAQDLLQVMTTVASLHRREPSPPRPLQRSRSSKPTWWSASSSLEVAPDRQSALEAAGRYAAMAAEHEGSLTGTEAAMSAALLYTQAGEGELATLWGDRAFAGLEGAGDRLEMQQRALLEAEVAIATGQLGLAARSFRAVEEATRDSATTIGHSELLVPALDGEWAAVSSRAEALLDDGEVDEAERIIRDELVPLTAGDPARESAVFVLTSRVWASRHDFEMALRALDEEALPRAERAADPRQLVDVHTEAALCLSEMGRHGEAIERLEGRAMELARTNAALVAETAVVLCFLASRRGDQAKVAATLRDTLFPALDTVDFPLFEIDALDAVERSSVEDPQLLEEVRRRLESARAAASGEPPASER